MCVQQSGGQQPAAGSLVVANPLFNLFSYISQHFLLQETNSNFPGSQLQRRGELNIYAKQDKNKTIMLTKDYDVKGNNLVDRQPDI